MAGGTYYQRRIHKLHPDLVSTFCQVFGEKYRREVGPQTSMSDVPEWDSGAYLDLVFQIEDTFGVEFTDDEAAQMTGLASVQRLLDRALLNQPTDDTTNAITEVARLRQNASVGGIHCVLMATSTTREGLSVYSEAVGRFQKTLGSDTDWYNISVNNLVFPEMLALIESLPTNYKGTLFLGTSPALLGGCNPERMRMVAGNYRFPFPAPRAAAVLKDAGFPPNLDFAGVPMDLDQWMDRFSRGRTELEHSYAAYQYMESPGWSHEKFETQESIKRYYRFVSNVDQSIAISKATFAEIFDWQVVSKIPIALIELPLHNNAKSYLEKEFSLVSRHREFVDDLIRDHNVRYLDLPEKADLNDFDFRDPGHPFRKRETLTQALVNCAAEMLK